MNKIYFLHWPKVLQLTRIEDRTILKFLITHPTSKGSWNLLHYDESRPNNRQILLNIYLHFPRIGGFVAKFEAAMEVLIKFAYDN